MATPCETFQTESRSNGGSLGCQHSQTVQNDDNFIVCLNCAMVVSEDFGQPADHHTRADLDLTTTAMLGKSHSYGVVFSRQNVVDRLYDICSNNHVVHSVYIRAVEHFKALCKTSHGGGLTYQHLMTAALYRAFHDDNATRSPQEVADLCGLSLRQFWSMENRLALLQGCCHDPEMHCRRLCLRFPGLSYSDVEHILNIQRQWTLFGGERPQTIAAAAIYEYTQQTQKGYSLVTVANTCGITPSNVRKLLKRVYLSK